MLLQNISFGGSANFNLVLSANTDNYSVSSALQAAGWNGSQPVNATITVDSGVVIGSTSATSAAFTLEAMPAGSIIKLINNGTISGCGGAGGDSTGHDSPGSTSITNATLTAGQKGGTALSLSYALSITNNGTIQGGGGGGGAAWKNLNYDDYNTGGGGGAGSNGGTGGAASSQSYSANGSAGTLNAGGAKGVESSVCEGGNGGAPGSAGVGGTILNNGTNQLTSGGGAAGDYINGSSYATWLVTGTRLGGAV